jgi:hypothetical protein
MAELWLQLPPMAELWLTLTSMAELRLQLPSMEEGWWLGPDPTIGTKTSPSLMWED